MDGGSEDGSREYLQNLEDNNIKIVLRESPRGQGNARNKGIEKSEGDYILFLDDDDLLEPNAIKDMVDSFKSLNEDCAGIITGERQFEDSDKIKPVSEGLCRKVTDLWFGTSCTMFRSDIFDELNGFNEELKASEDLEFLIRLFSNGYSLYGINRPLYRRRIHEDQLTKRYREVIESNYTILKMHKGNLSAEVILERYEKIASLQIELEEKSNALDTLKKHLELLEDSQDEISVKEKFIRYERLARLYAKAGDTEEASNSVLKYRNILESNKQILNTEETYNLLNIAANLHIQLDDDHEADSALVSIFNLVENNKCCFEEEYLLYRRIGLKFVKTGNNGRARSCLKASIKSNPSDRFSYYYFFWLIFGNKGYATGRRIEDLLKKPRVLE